MVCTAYFSTGLKKSNQYYVQRKWYNAWHEFFACTAIQKYFEKTKKIPKIKIEVAASNANEYWRQIQFWTRFDRKYHAYHRRISLKP